MGGAYEKPRSFSLPWYSVSFISLALGCNLGSGETAEITLNAVVAGEGTVERTVDEDP